MEVDLVIALKSWPTKPKGTFNTRILSTITHGFNKIEGATPFPTSTPIEITTFFNGVIDHMLFDMIVKDKCANLVVEFDIEGGTSILVQPETIIILTTITLNLVFVMEILGVDVRVEEIKAITMEE